MAAVLELHQAPDDPIDQAVAMFGPTIALDTRELFEIVGASQAMAFFLHDLAVDDIGPVSNLPNDAGYLLDGSDIHHLHEAFLDVDVAYHVLLRLLLPADEEVSDAAYDSDPRVLAVDAAVNAAEKPVARVLKERFKPDLKTAKALAAMCGQLNDVLVSVPA